MKFIRSNITIPASISPYDLLVGAHQSFSVDRSQFLFGHDWRGRTTYDPSVASGTPFIQYSYHAHFAGNSRTTTLYYSVRPHTHLDRLNIDFWKSESDLIHAINIELVQQIHTS